MARFYSKIPEKYIEIKKDNIPYEFTLDNIYYWEIRYNTYEDRFRFILYDRSYDENDGKGRVLGDGEEKAVLDFPLFFIFNSDSDGGRNDAYPSYDLIPRSIDGLEYEVNWDNLGETIFIEVDGDI
jgi:hypothetical protein